MTLLTAARRMPREGVLLLLGAAGDLAGEIDQRLYSSRRPYALVVPPGGTVLRRLSIPAVGRRGREQALRLAAEASLTEPLDSYLVDYWRIDAEQYGLAAIPRNLLARYQEFANERGQAARRIQSPELTADLKDGLVLWVMADAVTACIWHRGTLTDWQAIPRANGMLALEQLLRHGVASGISQVIVRSAPTKDQPFAQSVSEACARALPGAEVQMLDDPITGPGQGRRTLCTFDAFVSEQSHRPASGARRRGAALATLALLTALSWFLYLQLRDLEDQAARAEHTASLLKMQAGRSVRIADRVGRLTGEVREMQALDDASVVTLLDNLAELMPATVRLAGMLQLDRRGVLTLDGLAQAERDISGFVGELRRHPQVSQVRLQSVTASRSEKSQEQGVRFRLQVRLATPLWQPPTEEGV